MIANNKKEERDKLLARLIAFYLPQYHPIPENDKWWGKGFTEWTNVAKSKPLFRGHYQPHIPADLGFCDLRVPETRIAQAQMAREYGIEGFCYWHYWFAGQQLLERPFNEVLESGEPDFPFCVAWANQTWSGIWHGCPDRTLIEQTYPDREDYKSHFYALLGAFCDDRYITIDGKKVFIVYKPDDLPDPQRFTDYWRELAVESGLKGLYFIGIIHKEPWEPEKNGFDAATTNPPAVITSRLYPDFFARVGQKLATRLLGFPQIYTYKYVVEHAFRKRTFDSKHYPCVIPNWDVTPRRGIHGTVLHNSTPELYGRHLREAIGLVAGRPADRRIIFIKSWNEWAEGNHLEPDLRFGTAYLEVQKLVCSG